MILENSLELPFRYSSFIQNFHQEKNLKAFYNEEKQLFFLEFTPDKNVEGPPNHVHGGYLASILDEAMGAIMFLSGYFGMTYHFEVVYKRPVPLSCTHYIESKLEKVEKRKIYISAKVFSKDKIYTTSKAIFMQFDFQKLGLTPEYKLLMEFQTLKKSGISLQEALKKIHNLSI
ncbi:MAG: PaaI family thioesterase [Leptonema sp. (in: bacteria)]